ncbi:MAG: hypothetical protein IR158_05165 [Cellulomonas sp.]|uniref:DUF6518 family protein n=1 Tax=Cellulomonas sp. TaxID=40001 RepID=UPI001A0F3AFA|nr:DUF6518 family protein [Cellulomonas sp.]MBF0687144.1 hypothetical protein [Cellulomonas sp.]
MAVCDTLDDRPVTVAGPAGTRVLALAVVAGLVSGVLTSFGQAVLPGPLAGLANAVAPWLVVPFAVGALTRRWAWALVAGAVACLGQVVGYYVTADLRGFPVGTTRALCWLLAGLPGGVVAGVAGWSWWRSGRGAASVWSGRERGLGGAVLVAVWLAEAIVTYAIGLRYPGHALVFAGVAVVVLSLLGLRGRQHGAVARWLGPVAVLGCVGFGAL